MNWIVNIPPYNKAPNLYKLLGGDVIRDISLATTNVNIALNRAGYTIELTPCGGFVK